MNPLRNAIERLTRPRATYRRPLLLVIGAIVGFLTIVATQLDPPDPESRLPESFRLAALIQRQQRESAQQRGEIEDLRAQVATALAATQEQGVDALAQKRRLEEAGLTAGTTALEGRGVVVTLDDSSLSSAPSGNVNDLVIHSQDVQAVVNGMWAAGADAVAINDQRVIATSAVLCVGNTLLINGTVHSPPYEVVGIGVSRAVLIDDPLVRRLRQDAERFSLRVSISGEKEVEVPAYVGLTSPRYAQVATG